MRDAAQVEVNRKTVSIVYGAAFLQGLTMVSFPASSIVLKDVRGLTDAQYGFIFVPQFVAAILGSIAGGSLVRRMGLRNLLVWSLLANALSQAFLAATVFEWVQSFYTVLAGTAMLGVAFGLSAAPLNTFPGLFFPQKPDSALVALHTLLGLGLSAGPLVAGQLIARGMWVSFPLLLFVVSFLLAIGAAGPQLSSDAASADRSGASDTLRELRASPVLWAFAAIVVLYAFAEGTFSNWSVIYLHEERGIGIAGAGLALSVFWAMMAAGRLLVSVLLLRVAPERIWLSLPFLIAAGFFLVPLAQTAVKGIVVFGFAGLACSAFFPLSVGLAAKRFPGNAPFVSSLMIAALMSGVGIGSYIIGPLHSFISLERIYRISAVYPAAAVILAAITIRRDFRRSKGPAAGKIERGRTDRQ